jgi:hypothetical protein
MARLINTTAMTVDDVIDVGDWFVAVGDHDDAARSLFETDDAAMLVGRKSFEGFAAYWPSASGPWADVLNPMPKYVASRSALGPLAWNATAIEGDSVEGVRKLKAGLVDELCFWIHPRTQGPGGRPYEAATIPVRLIEARQFDSGVTLLRYTPLQNR